MRCELTATGNGSSRRVFVQHAIFTAGGGEQRGYCGGIIGLAQRKIVRTVGRKTLFRRSRHVGEEGVVTASQDLEDVRIDINNANTNT